MAVYEVPLAPEPQLFSFAFPNGVTYQFRLIYQFTPLPCWLLDVSDANGEPLVCGIPLVTGADLFAQFAYVGFGCSLYCTTDGDPGAVPLYYNLGKTAHLWIEG